MTLYEQWKKTKEPINWNDAYEASPNYKEDADGIPFGYFPLTDKTKLVFPKKPQYMHFQDNKKIITWKIYLFDSATNSVIGQEDFFVIAKKLENFVIDSTPDYFLIRELSIEELHSLINNTTFYSPYYLQKRNPAVK